MIKTKEFDYTTSYDIGFGHALEALAQLETEGNGIAGTEWEDLREGLKLRGVTSFTGKGGITDFCLRWLQATL